MISTSDDVRQVDSPTKRPPLQRDVGHLTDDLRVHVPRVQDHLGDAGDAVGATVSHRLHAGLEGRELIPILEPSQADVAGGEAMGLAGEAHGLLRGCPHCRTRHLRVGGLGYKRNIHTEETEL